MQPAGAGAVLEVQDRLASRGASQGNNLVVQDSVGGHLFESPQILSGPSPFASAEYNINFWCKFKLFFRPVSSLQKAF